MMNKYSIDGHFEIATFRSFIRNNIFEKNQLHIIFFIRDPVIFYIAKYKFLLVLAGQKSLNIMRQNMCSASFSFHLELD